LPVIRIIYWCLVADGTFLRAAGVTKVLGSSRVLRGVDAEFAAGTVHVVEGPNGSGKSTLLAILGGRMRPLAGRALLQRGEVAVAEGAALRRTVGWLGHELGLYGDLDVFANLKLHAQLRGLDPDAAWTAAAASFGIDGLRDRRVRELSRGQRQRVALARTMIGDPPVLLLDEPSTGLDATAVERLAAQVKVVVDRGAIVVAVTHDPGFAESLAGRRWVMKDGKLA
jgi:heme ABC exporter ATP-binding subunit CcmA